MEDENLKQMQLGKLTTNAITLFAGKLSKLEDRELRTQMLATKDRLARYAAMTFTEGIMLGLQCTEAYRRWGRTGGYQKFLENVGVSQSKASRWQRIADALSKGVLPANPPDEDGEEEWTQAAALEYISSPANATDAERAHGEKSVRARKGGKAGGGAHERYMRMVTKLVAELQAALQEGEPVEGAVAHLARAARQLNTQCQEAIEGETTPT